MKTIHSPEYQRLLKWLRTIRHERGLTMRGVASLLGRPHSWVGKVEIGERRLDVMEYLRLCEALQADPIEGLKVLQEGTAEPRTRLRAAEKREPYRTVPPR